MSNLQNLGNLLNYDNEIGTPQKPPKLLNVNDYCNWKARFEHYISYTDSSLWIPILEGYKHPTHIYLDETMPKPISKLSDEEKKAYDRENKALGSITMALTRELFHSFRENESLNDLISRFYHLQIELKAFELRYPDEEMVEKFLDALPPKFEMYTTLMRENPKFYELTVEEAIGKSSGSGIALFTGNPTEEDHSTGCGGHACYALGSGLGSHHQHTSRNPPATSSANQSAIARIAEDHVALFSSCLLAYENFIGGKLTDPETIEEDFNQVDPDDMEDMDIQWNIAMLLRRAKRFLNRTGRKFIGGHPNAKVGFDKSKAKCYKCLNFGHFAHECQKDRAPASGFTRPSQGNSHGHDNSNNHNQSQSGTSNALVGLMAEIMEMMEAEKREASMADLEESTTVATEEVKEA
ncbi:hypothetical protein L1987_01850 [Smallanthus sonchifolius]|uniref:Uncharacterized protein n=1 Tax=Smallanthus sonchifolius TaxID=185202 RepID=A0ACB9K671_9ASTR|nr:hypothetical protein L1987_01850 [Smallanthus sonchifolius]